MLGLDQAYRSSRSPSNASRGGRVCSTTRDTTARHTHHQVKNCLYDVFGSQPQRPHSNHSRGGHFCSTTRDTTARPLCQVTPVILLGVVSPSYTVLYPQTATAHTTTTTSRATAPLLLTRLIAPTSFVLPPLVQGGTRRTREALQHGPAGLAKKAILESLQRRPCPLYDLRHHSRATTHTTTTTTTLAPLLLASPPRPALSSPPGCRVAPVEPELAGERLSMVQLVSPLDPAVLCEFFSQAPP